MTDAQERTPRTYADLLSLLEAAPVCQPADSATPGGAILTAADGSPITDREIDMASDRQIAGALQIDVLGRTEAGEIKVYSEFLRRSMILRGVDRMKYPAFLGYFGTPGRKAISKTNEDAAPGMFPISDVREAIEHLSSLRVLSDETELGPGVWPVLDESSNGKPAITACVLVNSHEAMHYNGVVERITHPRHRGHLLSFESGSKPWYEYEHLVGLLEQAKALEFREKTVDDLVRLFGRWRWRGSHDATLMAGLVLATWVQTLWSWRPRIDILGASNTGKSMLCAALAGLYRDCVLMTSDTTAAGLRQKIKNSATSIVVDEVDAKNKAKMARQREILEMLRSASRGTSSIRGSGSQKAVEFTLRHLVWVAGISLNYDDQADRNRAVILNLLPPRADMAGKLILPSADELHDLGQRALATALWSVQDARCRAVGFKDEKIEGVDSRLIESYAVPAAILSVAMGMDDATGRARLRKLLEDVQGEAKIEQDEASLITDILTANVQWLTDKRTVAQALGVVMKNTEPSNIVGGWKQALEGVGIRVFDKHGRRKILFAYKMIRAKLFRGGFWEFQSIEVYLKRMPGSEYTKQRVGDVPIACFAFDLEEFIKNHMAADETEHAEADPF